jgi:hypothetical protein
MQTYLKASAVFFTILATLMFAWFLRLKWQPGVDFDLTGFFWLLRNAGRLSVFVLFAVCAALAVKYWLRSYLSDR